MTLPLPYRIQDTPVEQLPDAIQGNFDALAMAASAAGVGAAGRSPSTSPAWSGFGPWSAGAPATTTTGVPFTVANAGRHLVLFGASAYLASGSALGALNITAYMNGPSQSQGAQHFFNSTLFHLPIVGVGVFTLNAGTNYLSFRLTTGTAGVLPSSDSGDFGWMAALPI